MIGSNIYTSMYEPGDRVSCDLCFKSFSRKSDLRYHIYTHFPEEYLTCEGCQQGCKSWKLLKKHFLSCSNPINDSFQASIKNEIKSPDTKKKTPLTKPHKSTPRIPKEYLCHFCYRTYKTPIGLKQHISVHNDISYQCDLCKKLFSSKHGLQKHVYSHYPEEYLTCKGCQTPCETNAHYRKHINDCVAFKQTKKVNLKKNAFKCSLCSKDIFTKRGLRQHMFSHFPEEYLTCRGCWESFKTVTAFKRHKRGCENFKAKKLSALKRKIYNCDLCEKILFTKKGTREHIYSHFPKEYLTCEVCKKTCESLKFFKTHMRHCGAPKKIVGDAEKQKEFYAIKKAHRCDLCKKTLMSKGGLRAHIYSHFPEEYCSCRGCGTTCKNMWAYKRHVRDCSSLNQKKLKKLTKKILICDLCGKKYSRKFGIRRHMFAHFPEEYLICEGCNIFCRNVKGLVLHLRECGETKKRKKRDLTKNGHACELCRRMFFSKDGIRKHMYSHFPEEYCTCKGCGTNCHTPWFLRKHERICDKVWKEKCPLCSKVFWEYSKTKLHKHLDWHAKKAKRKAKKKPGKKIKLSTQSEIIPQKPKIRVNQFNLNTHSENVYKLSNIKVEPSVYVSRETMNDYAHFEYENKDYVKSLVSDVEIKEEVF